MRGQAEPKLSFFVVDLVEEARGDRCASGVDHRGGVSFNLLVRPLAKEVETMCVPAGKVANLFMVLVAGHSQELVAVARMNLPREDMDHWGEVGCVNRLSLFLWGIQPSQKQCGGDCEKSVSNN